MPKADVKTARVLWSHLTAREEHQGHWVALEDVRYDDGTREPLDGVLVDSDEDLAVLCSRIQQREQASCSILFCGDSDRPVRHSSRWPRAAYSAAERRAS